MFIYATQPTDDFNYAIDMILLYTYIIINISPLHHGHERATLLEGSISILNLCILIIINTEIYNPSDCYYITERVTR